MSRVRTNWWVGFGLGAAVVLAALTWITVVTLELERAERVARADAEHQESLRLALWRMDSWLAPRLAREASRPREDYLSLSPQQQAYTEDLAPIESGKVLTPSPLLSSRSEFFTLYFQVDAEGQVTSPQAPRGGLREAVANDFLSAALIEANDARLGIVASAVTPQILNECVPPAAAAVCGPAPAAPDVATPVRTQSQEQRSDVEFSKRLSNTRDNLDASSETQVGPLVAVWTGTVEQPGQLVFLRSVVAPEGRCYQGFLADWQALQQTLQAEIVDLIPSPMLVPIVDNAQADGNRRLATIPVALLAPITYPRLATLSPTRLVLTLTWIAVIAGIIAVGASLRASVAFGLTRSRFASAVTHELRTPLTTFRLYTEMLNAGMVPDEDRRRVYLQTLEEEATRLSALVENVLDHARLEEGRHIAERRRVGVRELLDTLASRLERRAESAGTTLQRDDSTPPATTVEVDVEAVGQILFNLVDNACKYGATNGRVGIDLIVTRDDRRVHIDVRDHGPGIPTALTDRVFRPFERGAHTDDPAPGLGIGLSLSRGLAREMGGELKLMRSPDGACFRLTLPGGNAETPKRRNAET